MSKFTLLPFLLVFLATCGYKAPPPGKPDWTPPQVKVVFPEEGDTIFSDTSVIFSVLDESPVKKVILLINGRTISQDSVQPLSLLISVDSLKDTQNEIKIKAVDLWDNMGESLPVKVFRVLSEKDHNNHGKSEGVKPEEKKLPDSQNPF